MTRLRSPKGLHPLLWALEERRRQAKVPQKTLAEAAGITQSTLSSLLSGRNRAALEVVDALASALGCKLVLMAGDDQLLPLSAPTPSDQPTLTEVALHQREIVRLMELMAKVTDALAEDLEKLRPEDVATPPGDA